MTSHPTIRLLAVLACVLCASLNVGAQRGGGGGGGGGIGGGGGVIGGRGFPGPQDEARRPNQDEAPTFRSSVTLVQIDAIVTDMNGRPVTGLTADDFEISEAGQPRAIETFAAVDMPMPQPLPAAAAALPEADVVSNAMPPGRVYLIALDEVGSDRALRARHFLRQFIDRYLGPNDVAAVALVGRGLANSGQDFTRNKRLVHAAIDRFSGGFETFDGTGTAPATSDSRQLASGLRQLTEFLAAMPGRKVMIYVGEGMAGLDPYAATEYRGGALTPGELDLHEAMAAATRGNVTIYPVDPRGLTTDTTAAESFDTTNLDARADLSAIADVTGGFALVGSNSYQEAFERLVQENSVYYTLGFGSEYPRRDGRFVRVQVRVKRPGLQVRSRNGYVAPLGQERQVAMVSGDARMATVADALSNPLAVSDLTMRAVASPYRGSGRNAAVAVVLEFDVSKLDLAEKDGTLTGPVEIAYLATDAKGKQKPGRRHSATVSIKQSARDTAFRVGARAVSEFELPPGRYQLRIAAGGHTRAGSIVYDLEVPDFRRDPLTLSGVSFTSASAPAVMTLPLRDLLGTNLPGPPMAARDFSNVDVMGLYVEVYENAKNAPASTVTIDLRDPEGKVVQQFTNLRSQKLVRAGGAGRGITATTPLRDVPPGPYVLRIEARGGQDARAVREVPVRIW